MAYWDDDDYGDEENGYPYGYGVDNYWCEEDNCWYPEEHEEDDYGYEHEEYDHEDEDDDYEDEADNGCYVFRVPTASLIFPHETREETFSALIDANNSRPLHKRLPVDILLLVNDELHPPDPALKELHSIWTVDTEFEKSELYEDYLEKMLLNTTTQTFYISDEAPPINHREIHDSVSAADLLYRMRCLFPNIPVDSEGPNGYEQIWRAVIQHKQSGVYLEFYEYYGGATVTATLDRMLYDGSHNSGHDYERATLSVPRSKEEAVKVFTTDALRLLNTLFGTMDGKSFIYYHPAAKADYPTDYEHHFLAVPRIRLMERVETENTVPYTRWCPAMISPTDLSSFKSLLPDLKYNIKLRKVDSVNGTTNLTTILSSSQLFYRLLCHYSWPYDNINDTPPITSVWQVKLGHNPSDDPSIIFMDDRGLFDIRAEEGILAEEVMNDLVDLVNALFSDKCCHPYGGVRAGCVA
ncbi:hypothetical protein Clacol_005352 [Clathrus columnatus]|uniref:Uncharacterized protein n=1 Tax=Clathrus columnatus TaxID=1419009 RepID=A0AAV5AF42_9AGAM|nr:hypothetical protein Clacol_005352 [Clathrus columnatus]